MLVGFTLLGSTQYMDLLLLQFAIWEYQDYFNHPVMDILRTSVSTFVGEDIEIFNRLLSHNTHHDSRRGEPEGLDESYRCLGMIVHGGISFNEELLECTKFIKGNRRYNVKLDGPEIAKARSFLERMFVSFSNEEFQHYTIPREGQKQIIDGKSQIVEMDTTNSSTMKFSSANTGTIETEAKTLELIDVGYVASLDWVAALKKKFDGVVKRTWKFSEHLHPSTLQRLHDDFPKYVGAPRPKSPQRKRGVKRKRDGKERKRNSN